MLTTKATKRYAKALLQFSVEKQEEQKVFEDMNIIEKTIEQNAELKQFLISPVVRSEAKKEVLEKVFSGVSNATERLFSILTENKRISLIGQVCQSFIFQYKQYKQEQVAVVITAEPISDLLKEKVLEKAKEITKNDKIILENKIDKNLIGGFVLRIGDLQYDQSVSEKFEKIQQQLMVK